MSLNNFIDNDISINTNNEKIIEQEPIKEPIKNYLTEKIKKTKNNTSKKIVDVQLNLTDKEKNIVRKFILGEKGYYKEIEEIYLKYKDKEIKDKYYLDFLNECNREDGLNLEKYSVSKRLILRG